MTTWQYVLLTIGAALTVSLGLILFEVILNSIEVKKKKKELKEIYKKCPEFVEDHDEKDSEREK